MHPGGCPCRSPPTLPSRTASRNPSSSVLPSPASGALSPTTANSAPGSASPSTAPSDAHGKITHPGYEHLTFHAVVQDIDPPSYFAFTWHPYAVDVAVDYSKETPTLVEFRLQPTADGTRLTVTESGFSDLPDDRRQEAFARNSEGWSMQMKNVEDYLAHQP